MSKSKKFLAVAVLTGLGLTVAGLTLIPLNGGARAVEAAPTIVAEKGDLGSGAGCTDQKWPNISTDCLVAADGASVRGARTITIGYQSGDATSVLVRMPAPHVAAP